MVDSSLKPLESESREVIEATGPNEGELEERTKGEGKGGWDSDFTGAQGEETGMGERERSGKGVEATAPEEVAGREGPEK